YVIIPEECKTLNTQSLKLRELPEDVLPGESPRSICVCCTGYLTDKVCLNNDKWNWSLYE
ncbi:hypothetical protein Pmar_PMAR027553, partial [Perkinsus marinus ATCC 50983]